MSTDMAARLRSFHAGFSLVELVMSIVVVGVGLATLLVPIITATKSSADPLVRKQSLAVAEALLEEIELKPFNDPGGGPCSPCAPTRANRPLFDDVSDYNGFTTTGIFTLDNVAIPALVNYNVTNVTVTGTALGAIPAASAKRITVTVTGPGGDVITLSAFRTNFF